MKVRNDAQNTDFTIALNSLPPVKAGSGTTKGATNRGYDFVVPFATPLIIPANAEIALHDFSGVIINHIEGQQVRNQYLDVYIEIPELMLKNNMVLNQQGSLVLGSYLPNKIRLPETPGLALVGNRDMVADAPFTLLYSPLNNPEPLYINQISVRLKTYQGLPAVQFQNHHPDLTIPDIPADQGPPAAANGNTNVGGTSVIINIRKRK